MNFFVRFNTDDGNVCIPELIKIRLFTDVQKNKKCEKKRKRLTNRNICNTDLKTGIKI